MTTEKPAMRAVALRHVAFEDLGVLAPLLSARGYAIETYEAPVADFSRDALADADLLVVLGGPICVYDEPAYPFLAPEQRLIERRLASGKPLLGICLGAQLIAAAAGARVFPGRAKEIGFARLTLTPEGAGSCLSALSACDFNVLHWHGDTFDLPAGADRLASTDITENQAFSLGPCVLGLQFHMEADTAMLERWLVGHACELGQAKLDVADLRRAGARYGGPVTSAGAKAFAAWLDSLATPSHPDKNIGA